ncbi:MAG: hypothetical protein IJ111_13635 [Eggerthellaceae bacterium]|nr:hypothetical protein [Eggerthellaceae bacterium]
MALPEVTYADYETWGGTRSEDAFEASIGHARARVREYVWLNEVDTDERAAAFKAAVCAAVDVDAAYGSTGGVGESGGGFSIGSFSMSAASGADARGSSYDRDMARAIRAELSGTGLLYQGVR